MAEPLPHLSVGGASLSTSLGPSPVVSLDRHGSQVLCTMGLVPCLTYFWLSKGICIPRQTSNGILVAATCSRALLGGIWLYEETDGQWVSAHIFRCEPAPSSLLPLRTSKTTTTELQKDQSTAQQMQRTHCLPSHPLTWHSHFTHCVHPFDIVTPCEHLISCIHLYSHK